MSIYDRSIASALRMIERYGVQCQWTSGKVVAADPDRPWLGGAAEPGTHEPFICFLPASTTAVTGFGLTAFRKDTDVGEFSTYGLMGAQDFTPDMGDRVLRDGQPLVIKNIDVLMPADVPILYILSIV